MQRLKKGREGFKLERFFLDCFLEETPIGWGQVVRSFGCRVQVSVHLGNLMRTISWLAWGDEMQTPVLQEEDLSRIAFTLTWVREWLRWFQWRYWKWPHLVQGEGCPGSILSGSSQVPLPMTPPSFSVMTFFFPSSSLVSSISIFFSGCTSLQSSVVLSYRAEWHSQLHLYA